MFRHPDQHCPARDHRRFDAQIPGNAADDQPIRYRSACGLQQHNEFSERFLDMTVVSNNDRRQSRTPEDAFQFVQPAEGGEPAPMLLNCSSADIGGERKSAPVQFTSRFDATICVPVASEIAWILKAAPDIAPMGEFLHSIEQWRSWVQPGDGLTPQSGCPDGSAFQNMILSK